MLNRVETKIMDYLFAKCRGSKPVLVTPKEILSSLLPKYEFTAKQLDASMKNLALDGYIDVYNSDNKGQLVYVVTLKTRGEAYDREKADIRSRRVRSIGWKVLLTVGGSILGFIVTLLLYRIFK